MGRKKQKQAAGGEKEQGQQQQQRDPQQQSQQQRGPQQQHQQQRGPQQQQQSDPQQQQQRGPQQQSQQQRGPQQQSQQQRGPQQQSQQQRGPQQKSQQQRGPQQQSQQHRGPSQQQQQSGPQKQQHWGPQQQQQYTGPQQHGGPSQQQHRGPPQQQQHWGPQQQQQFIGPQQHGGPSQQQHRGPPQQQQHWGPQQQQQFIGQQQHGGPSQQHRGPQQQQQQSGPYQQLPESGSYQQQQQKDFKQQQISQRQPWGPPKMQQQSISQKEAVGPPLSLSPAATSPTPSQESSSSGVIPKAAAGVGGEGKKGRSEQKQRNPSSGKPPTDKKELKESLRLPDEELALEIPSRRKSDKKMGRIIQLETNHFALTISKNLKLVYQYDVTVDPDRPKKMLPIVMEEFRKRYFPNRFPAYDGMKNLFATSLLPLNDNILSDTITVFMPDNENNKDYKVTVKFNGKTVDMTPVQEYLKASSGGVHLLPPQDVLTVLDVVLRKAPALTFISVGRSFFSPPKERIIQLGDGMEMYNGFYQSAILGWKPFLNVDVAHKAFPTRLDGISLLMDLLRCSENELQGPLRSSDITLVDKFLRTLKVQYLIPTQPGSRRVMRVNAVDQPADKAMFNHNNERMTVKDYFTKIKGYRLRFPHLPCLWVGSKSRPDKILLPIELCTVVEGQAVNRKMTPDQTSAMIRHAATNTEVRKNKIMTSLRNANYNQHPVVREFEISVSANMERISGRVLAPPTIGYANNKTENPKRGVWRAQSFYRKCEVKNWTILNLDRRTREETLGEFAMMMQVEGRKLGMDIAPPGPFLAGLDNRNPLKSIISHMSNLKQKQITFVVVVLTEQVPNCYSYVKQAAEIQVGLLTQCVKSRNVYRPKNMTVMNILLKVNSKLNGVNHVMTQKPLCLRRPCMIMGADVTHPSPDAQDTPSVAAVTASHDPTAFKYNICWRLQPPRTEIIEDLENIVWEQLKYFYDHNKQLKPEHLIFFRDGVSEGFFKYVMNREVAAIRRACTRMNREYQPPITFLVVQKRHHTRLFPLNPRDSEDKNFNVPAGTCVDEWITHPTATDFYLVSHASIQGVAKPTKYRVLWDDLKMSENDLEELAYHLCHMFSRCTRSVSYPAPTYYAHLAAARAKVYIETRNVNINNLQREQETTQIKELIIKGTPMFFV